MEENKWDKKYREGFYENATEPHELLKRFYSLIPENGRVLDIAMGNGRDGAFLSDRGYSVFGVESSEEAIKIAQRTYGRSIHIVKAKAENLPIKPSSMDGVIVFYFLIRDIRDHILSLLKKGGILIYETFLKRQNEIDRKRNPAYLLNDGELLTMFQELELIFYEETIVTSDKRKRATARFIGRKV
ncbi:MAG: class I SAM-dependent methyltransferase [Syntrophorhabdaceae bacterium]|nr:class I SAM-dependent methyltransferase [Syntrophorhabdaceae bacterium]